MNISLCCYTILAIFLLIFQTFSHGLSLHPLPTSLKINQVTQSYPPTLFRTLFSSIPKRELAVNNVTLQVESQLVNIIGASSSGKSTILRLVLGEKSQLSGSISWYPSQVKPVYLEQGRSPFACERSQTVETILSTVCKNDYVDADYYNKIVTHVCETVGLTERELQSTPSELSPSNLYRFHLVKASLESILPALNADDMQQDNSVMPSPLLLLDEWMDLETSSIVQRVEESLVNLTQDGAVILCVTHKPQLFSKSHPTIIMCRGEILEKRDAQ